MDLASYSPEVAEAYDALVETFSETASRVRTMMRAMNSAWKRAQAMAEPTGPPHSVPELSPSPASPSGSNVQYPEALARDSSFVNKLADAAASCLKRKDEQFMGEVFGRHAKPLGMSAVALVSALHAIDPSKFSVPADAANFLKEVDISNKGHANLEDFYQAAGIMPIANEWKCVNRDGVSYRKSPSMTDLMTHGPDFGNIITAVNEVLEHDNWLKVERLDYEQKIETRYLPITHNGKVLFERERKRIPSASSKGNPLSYDITLLCL